jgi:hypothetical protein
MICLNQKRFPCALSIETKFHNITIHLVYLACSSVALSILIAVPLSWQVDLTNRNDFSIPFFLFLVIFFSTLIKVKKYIRVVSIVILRDFYPAIDRIMVNRPERTVFAGVSSPISDNRGFLQIHGRGFKAGLAAMREWCRNSM